MGLCGSGTDPVEAARAAEADRRAGIEQGQQNISQAFKGFDPAFYDARKQAYLNYATPQLATQTQSTGKALTFQLARQGLLHSGAAEQQARALQRSTLQAQQGVSDEASNQANQLRQSVEQERSRLTNQLVNSADPNIASQQSLASASNLHLPSTFAPIGDAFQSFAQQNINRNLAQIYQQPYGGSPAPGSGGSGLSFLGSNRVTRSP